jgi:hypothetical protein
MGQQKRCNFDLKMLRKIVHSKRGFFSSELTVAYDKLQGVKILLDIFCNPWYNISYRSLIWGNENLWIIHNVH